MTAKSSEADLSCFRLNKYFAELYLMDASVSQNFQGAYSVEVIAMLQDKVLMVSGCLRST